MHYTAHQPELQDASARATRLFWIICLLGWAAMLTVTASSLFVAGFRPFRLVVEMTLALWLPYVAFTPVVFLLVRRFPITAASWRSAIFIHLLASIIFVVVCEGFFLCEVSVLGPAAVSYTHLYITIHFLDGTTQCYEFEMHEIDPMTISAKMEKAISRNQILIQLADKLCVIPLQSVKQFELTLSALPAKLPEFVFANARLVE